jgi:hypothetical protein
MSASLADQNVRHFGALHLVSQPHPGLRHGEPKGLVAVGLRSACHRYTLLNQMFVNSADYLMACSAQAANCQTTWLIPSAPSSSSKPHRNRQRDREHVMRPELQHDAARAPHRHPPIAFKVSQQPMMDTAASIAGYND